MGKGLQGDDGKGLWGSNVQRGMRGPVEVTKELKTNEISPATEKKCLSGVQLAACSGGCT